MSNFLYPLALCLFVVDGAFASGSFLQSTSSGTDLQTYTFSSQNLGTASSDRYILVAIVARDSENNISINSLTVGGVTATISTQAARNDTSNSSLVGIGIAAVPTGTTGDVVVQFNTTVLRCGIALYSATALNPTYYGKSSVALNDPSTTVNVPANGYVLAVGTTASATATATWTGLTENVDAAVGAEASRIYAASDNFATAQTPLTVTATIGTGESNSIMAVSSWGLMSSNKTNKMEKLEL